ncbi:hypothetical protein PAXRUDRAFT_833320 [Paxillus rubicundulus Ve08.2h10]|uniref:Uncharacterized protein n=1 Tax=Paxillus rubicundulus Ve08.2h10 TaxID=930991 RepID=A0A0D0CDM4_9AGAM|nr:hypothetical protein PAXRUDRAFT_833320 [Paxillus rubicundulus Ve08.2h10]
MKAGKSTEKHVKVLKKVDKHFVMFLMCIFSFLIRDVEISSKCILVSGQRGESDKNGEVADGNEAQQGLRAIDLIAR